MRKPFAYRQGGIESAQGTQYAMPLNSQENEMDPWSLIVRAVKPLKTEKGIRNHADKGGEFETIGGYSTGERITLDAAMREVFPTIQVVYGPNTPAEAKYFAL